jgi:hypothetical protein
MIKKTKTYTIKTNQEIPKYDYPKYSIMSESGEEIISKENINTFNEIEFKTKNNKIFGTIELYGNKIKSNIIINQNH